MTSARRSRQLAELRALCGSGSIDRAVDLAFEHFACFGQNEEVVVLLSDVIARTNQPERVRARFAELCSSYGDRAGPARA